MTLFHPLMQVQSRAEAIVRVSSALTKKISDDSHTRSTRFELGDQWFTKEPCYYVQFSAEELRSMGQALTRLFFEDLDVTHRIDVSAAGTSMRFRAVVMKRDI